MTTCRSRPPGGRRPADIALFLRRLAKLFVKGVAARQVSECRRTGLHDHPGPGSVLTPVPSASPAAASKQLGAAAQPRRPAVGARWAADYC